MTEHDVARQRAQTLEYRRRSDSARGISGRTERAGWRAGISYSGRWSRTSRPILERFCVRHDTP